MLAEIFGAYYLNVGVIVGVYIILSLGLNITIGLAGQPSLGHGAFWAIGSYSSALFATALGLSFWLALPASVIFTFFMGVILGLPSIRVKEDFLVIVTLGLTLVVNSVAQYLPLTGGALGISNIPRPALFGIKFGISAYFIFVALWVVLCAFGAHKISTSWIGFSMSALRADEVALETVGVNTRRIKVMAFAIGAAYAGLAGSLFAHYMNFISPEMFGLNESVNILSMIVIGGLGSIRGSMLGALFLATAPETLRWAQEYRMTIIGVLMLLAIVYCPEGFFGGRTTFARLRNLFSFKVKVRHGPP